MMRTRRNGFEDSFEVPVDLGTAWRRLTAERLDDGRLWLPGFDSAVDVQVMEIDDPDEGPARLEAVKADDPCRGTDIVIRLDDRAAEHHTRLFVAQSNFGESFPAMRDVLEVGWMHIMADLHTFLTTGVHAGRHFREWGDLGAETHPADGGVLVGDVRPGGLADRLGLRDGDVLVTVCNTPVSSMHNLATILRVLANLDVHDDRIEAEWIRGGELCSGRASAAVV
jgi:hypothetical protein